MGYMKNYQEYVNNPKNADKVTDEEREFFGIEIPDKFKKALLVGSVLVGCFATECLKGCAPIPTEEKSYELSKFSKEHCKEYKSIVEKDTTNIIAGCDF